MIRIYLNWNVISTLKRPEFEDIKSFIDKHKKYLLFPYTPAHFSDLMKSYNPENKYFEEDLENLEYLCGNHLMRWENDSVKPLRATPTEFFKFEKQRPNLASLIDIDNTLKKVDEFSEEFGLDKIGTLMKSHLLSQLSDIEVTEQNSDILKLMFPSTKSSLKGWDVVKGIEGFAQRLMLDGRFYKEFRKRLGDSGFKLEANSGNWGYDEVVKNIDEFLLKQETQMTYIEFVASMFKYKSETINIYDKYTTAYLLLDMIGYKSDKLPKSTDNFQNIHTDSEHSFYGAYCDFFVAMDKKLRIKSKVLFSEFNITTRVIEPKEIIHELSSVIDEIKDEPRTIKKIVGFCNKDTLFNSWIMKRNNAVEAYVSLFKLPTFYFNYFNYVTYYNYENSNISEFIFHRASTNFTYYTELEALVNTITDFFGCDDLETLEMMKKEFLNDKSDYFFKWEREYGLVQLEKEEGTKLPILRFVLPTRKESK